MLTNEDLQALSSLMDQKLEPINARLDKIETRLDKIEEDGEITREVTNKIGEWVDFYFHDDKPYPLDEDEAERYRESLRLAK
jgi:tetrahydromethanopterin S-methyltransferase subunit G